MPLFAITCRLDGRDMARRTRALDRAVRALSPRTLVYDETAGFYLVKAEVTAQEVHEMLVASAGLRSDRDLLLVINLSRPEYIQAGSEIPQRLGVLMAAR